VPGRLADGGGRLQRKCPNRPGRGHAARAILPGRDERWGEPAPGRAHKYWLAGFRNAEGRDYGRPIRVRVDFFWPLPPDNGH
jgi:hypothetical protein